MKQIRMRFRLVTLIVIGLLGVAGIYGVYSVSMYGSRWFSNVHNTRYQTAKSTVIQGDITDRNGIVVATTDEDGNRVYQSNVNSRSAMVHLLGDENGNIANGVESFHANYLLGFETSLTERVLALLQGESRVGDNVQLTVDSKLQTEIVSYFTEGTDTKDKTGAAVVMNYKTGEIIAMVSLPVFDPQNVTEDVENDADHPFWNRATQALLPPGSIFKIVTASAAIDNLSNMDTSIFECTGATQVLDQIIQDYQQSSHGSITLAEAFTVSCNNVFAQAALLMGDKALRSTAEDFGFNDNFLFRDLVLENSIYPTSDRNNVEIAWSGAGQSQIAATPVHMCMMAAAIANDGVMMEPRLLKSVTTSTGLTRLSFSTSVYQRAVSEETASILQEYMKDVTISGTGTKAQVTGLTIAGKTGSAESSSNGEDVTHAWYVGYIEDDDLPYACCVLVEEGGSGGSVAAPIAAKIFSYLKTYMK